MSCLTCVDLGRRKLSRTVQKCAPSDSVTTRSPGLLISSTQSMLANGRSPREEAPGDGKLSGFWSCLDLVLSVTFSQTRRSIYQVTGVCKT